MRVFLPSTRVSQKIKIPRLLLFESLFLALGIMFFSRLTRRTFHALPRRLQQQQQQQQVAAAAAIGSNGAGWSNWIKYSSIVSTCLISGYLIGISTDSPKTSSTTPLADLKPLNYANLDRVNQALSKIGSILSNAESQMSISENELKNHSNDSSNFIPTKPNELPYAVIYPEKVDEVIKVVKICHEYCIPIIPYSGGTSIEGHFIPTRRGISIDVSRMNKIVEIHPDDLDVIVQPGVEWTHLNEELDQYGLIFGPDPAPGALIGGIIGTNASGTNAVKYGAAKDNVLSLKVVLADGTLIKTRQRPRKSSNGYNLTNLFIGSEGTLGIIVEATLKLHVKPQNEIITLINFKNIKDASKTVADLFKRGISCNAVEFMDNKQMNAIVEMGTGGDRKWLADHLLLLKLSALDDRSLKSIIDQVTKIGQSNNGFNIQVAQSEEDREDIWRIRKTLLWNSLNWAKKFKPNAQVLPTDVCVPVSKLPELITKSMDKMESLNLLATAAGHAGDGNLHVLVIFEPDQIEDAHSAVNYMSELAIKLDGTVSGEHGIGVSEKRELLELELGTETIDLMRSIKFALDKKGIMNPDHIFKIDPTENRKPFD